MARPPLLPPVVLVNIFDYLDYRKFLHDYTRALKRLRCFNLRDFSDKAGLKSPGFLKMVVDGVRDMTDETAQGFCTALNLTGRQAEYFLCLVHYNQADNPDDKKTNFTRMTTLRPKSSSYMKGKRVSRYFSKPHYVTIREMVLLKDFREDPEWIGAKCDPHVRPTDVKEAIKTLLELDLLRRDESGKLIHTETYVQTPERDAQDIEIYHYHEAMIDKARHALGHLKQEDRLYYALTVPMPDDMFDEIVTDILALKDRIVEKVRQRASTPNSLDNIYQANFQFFPITKKDPKP